MEYNNQKPLKRFISSDNSCLFNAINYVCNKENHNDNSANILRNIVANEIKCNPKKYNTTFLGMSNLDYQNYILDSKNWGGAIELDILSKYFKNMICVFQLKTLKKLCFGEDKNYENKVFIVYDEMHYDSLVLTHDETKSFDLDITKFQTDDMKVDELFFQLVYDMYNSEQFTDFSSIKLMCLDCMTKFTGHTEAIEHAQLTQHQNMTEIDY